MKKKKLISLLCGALCGVFVLSACGGGAGSSAASNELLGSVPGIFVEMAQEKQALNESLRNAKGVEEHDKLLKEYDEYVTECMQKAEEEGQKLVGREIPCTGDVYDEFKVTGAKITGYRGGKETGTIEVAVMVTPKYDMEVRMWQNNCAEGEYPLKDTRLYYALMKADDHLISLGTLNPFSSNAANTAFEYADGQSIKAGDPCNSAGSPIAISCHSYDYTEFAKIVFLKEADYKAIRKQAFGF